MFSMAKKWPIETILKLSKSRARHHPAFKNGLEKFTCTRTTSYIKISEVIFKKFNLKRKDLREKVIFKENTF